MGSDDAYVAVELALAALKRNRIANSEMLGAEPFLVKAVVQRDGVVAVHQKHAGQLLAANDDAESTRSRAERAARRAKALASKNEQLIAANDALDDLRVAQGQWLADIERAHDETDRARSEADAVRSRAEVASAAALKAEVELVSLREVIATLRPKQADR